MPERERTLGVAETLFLVPSLVWIQVWLKRSVLSLRRADVKRIAVADHAAATRGDATDRCVMRGRHASKNMGKWRDRRGSRDRQDNELTTMLPRPGVAAQSPTRSGLTIHTHERATPRRRSPDRTRTKRSPTTVERVSGDRVNRAQPGPRPKSPALHSSPLRSPRSPTEIRRGWSAAGSPEEVALHSSPSAAGSPPHIR